MSGQTQQPSATISRFMTDEVSALEQRVAQTNDPADVAMLDQLRKRIAENGGPLALQRPDLVGTIERIDVDGLSDSAKAQLLAQLPVHVGDPHSQAIMAQIRAAAQQFDEHLAVSGSTALGSGAWVVRIATPGVPLVPSLSTVPHSAPASAQRIGGNVQATRLISQEKPVYPPLAKMARQQGVVKFEATIARDGTVEDLTVISGPPLLIPAALNAVKKWIYAPTLLNGTPVEVVTTIDVSFSLSE